jgi:oligosaccharide repeat unit polymerase
MPSPARELLLFFVITIAAGLVIGEVQFPTFNPWVGFGVAAGWFAMSVALRSSGRVTLISPATLFVGLYLVLIHVGAVLAYLEAPAINGNFLRMSSVALLAFGAGHYLAGGMTRRRVRSTVSNWAPLHNDLVNSRLQVWKLYSSIGVASALYLLVVGARRAGGIPIVSTFLGGFGGSVRAYAANRLTFSQVPGGGYVYNLYAIMLPIAALAFYLRSRRVIETRSRLYAFVLMGISVVAAASGGYRGQVLILALLFIIGLSWEGGAAWASTSRRMGALVLVLVGLISAAAYSSADPNQSATSILATRVFRTQADGAQFIYQVFPEKVPFSKGRLLFDDFKGILPGRQPGLSSRLPALRGVKSLNNPVGAVAELYLNFGPYGMALAMFLFGAGTYWLHRRFLRVRTVSGVALGSGMISAIGYAASAGIVGVLLQYGIVTVLLMASGLRAVSSRYAPRLSNSASLDHSPEGRQEGARMAHTKARTVEAQGMSA